MTHEKGPAPSGLSPLVPGVVGLADQAGYGNSSPSPQRQKRTNGTAEQQVLDAIRQRIRALGLTLLEVDDRVGIADGYAGKLLRGHRRAKWPTLQALFDALWPHGVQITITGLPAPDELPRGRP